MHPFYAYLIGIAPISAIEFAKTLPSFKTLELKKGDFFVEQGHHCRHIAFINAGTLRIFYINDKAEETTACFCTANNLATSYKSFILQQVSNLSIEAIEDTDLLIIDYNQLQDLYARNTTWQRIGRTIAEREYLVMEQYASVLNNETAKQKYLRLLNEQPSVVQKASVQDIASYLGVTRRTLSRIRQELSS